MFKKKITFFFIICLLMVPSFATAQSEEIKEYTVIKGDTLWDISEKELHDNFLWPKVWQENPEVYNPDRIYPGQTIRIPLYLLKEDMPEEPVPRPVVKEKPVPEPAPEPEAPPPPSYLVNKGVYIGSGYISDTVPAVGKIIGSPEGKALFGDRDTVYVVTDNPVNIGDKFYVIRVVEELRHPVTNRKMGYRIEITGIAEIKKFQFGDTLAYITHAFGPIGSDNHYLEPYRALDPPLAEESYRRPSIDGYIVTTNLLHTLNSAYDIVYIDKGRNQGLRAGDLLRTGYVNFENHKVPNGVIQIINAQNNTSTAIVRQSSMPITTGQFFTQLEE